MATTGKKSSSSKKNTTQRKPAKKSTSGKSTAAKKKAAASQAAKDSEMFWEIGLIVLFVAMVFLFLCNFGIIGPVGDAISGVMFGLFGFTAYIVPVVLFAGTAFWFANEGSPTAIRKLIAGVILFFMLGIVFDLIAGSAAELTEYDIKALYEQCSTLKNGGGCIAGSISFLLQSYMETIGTVLVVILCSLISIILLTEKSLLRGMREGGSRIREKSREDARYRREAAQARREEQEERALLRREEQEEREQLRREEQAERNRQRREELEESRNRRARERQKREEDRKLKAECRENEKILRMDKKASGVMINTALERPKTKQRDDIHEITLEDLEDIRRENHDLHAVQNEYTDDAEGEEIYQDTIAVTEPAVDFERIQIRSARQMTMADAQEEEPEISQAQTEEMRQARAGTVRPSDDRDSQEEENLLDHEAESIRVHSEATIKQRPVAKLAEGQAQGGSGSNETAQDAEIRKEMQNKVPRKYIFPPLSRLQKGVGVSADSTRELKETAMRLQQTLNTFGVKVTITDISQGPSVTRYELQPEQGVKVSKIVNLADDIKLNLAATDIRIEAPIPGKAAIGIEVPNKENTPVALRDLLESSQFRDFPSNLAFAVGKDIAGQVVVSDIAKMPHMLIAGATGSGKSVCINTLIMSILYKAHPDDVKMIMVDPKVVELSVYNGIPHLLIPVVTDPKKAAAALHWGVSEMTDRYKKFADFNVRDLKGYNKKVEEMRERGQEDAPPKMPQIVIIVDELADLMMVSPGEVEESICRLAQLARAAGIHLIIATQRPSVDVITGLIKANMPSRVAFSVSSGVDSRTILDMNGAEKLLGKGDMLFAPQGYSKPARIQGAFVSDKEVSDVVDFLKNQAIGNVYAEDVEEKIKNIGSGSSGSGGSSAADERDEYFAEAGRFIIDKDKASIGMLQRVFKIGFNRAARIMDQLAEYGVVGEEEGTKPRKVLMSMEQFEQLLEEI